GSLVEYAAATRAGSAGAGHGFAPRGGGATRADRIWLWPVAGDRHHRRRYSGRDPEIRARAEVAGDRAGVGPSGARTVDDDRPSRRLTGMAGARVRAGLSSDP